MIDSINLNVEDVSNIILNELVPADAEDYFNLIDANRKYFANLDNMDTDKYETVDDVRRSLENPGVKKRFGIYDQGSLVGTINLTPDENDENRAELGYLVGEQHSRRGYATEATRKLINVCKNLKYKILFADANAENIGSQKVLLKLGFSPASSYMENGYEHIIFEIEV